MWILGGVLATVAKIFGLPFDLAAGSGRLTALAEKQSLDVGEGLAGQIEARRGARTPGFQSCRSCS